jgi:hypothetical protein
MTWFADQRQAWIAEMLTVYGFINREHLRRKFDISEPQASLDLQTFLRNHPDQVEYDLSAKCYVRVEPARSHSRPVPGRPMIRRKR